MYVLTKFFEKEAYRDDFIHGELYLSSMSQYSQLLPERALMEAAESGDKEASRLLNQLHNDEQRDIFEGTIVSLDKDQVGIFPEEMKKHISTNVRARAVGYNYSNLMCFCKMNYEVHRHLDQQGDAVEWHEPDMHAFGQYAIIVVDQQEFIKRVRIEADHNGYQFLCGSVSYHPLKCGEKMVKSGNLIDFLLDKEIQIEDTLAEATIEKYDAFDKWDRFKKQNEWRLVINKKEKQAMPLTMNVGDLSDITVLTEAQNLPKDMERLFLERRLKPSVEGFYGNISRARMKDEFYRLGDCKAYLISTIGAVEFDE